MISIKETKKIRDQLGLTHLVIFGIDDENTYHVATHGKTEKHARESAKAGNHLKKILKFPDHLCNDLPLQRVCANCNWYRSYYGVPDLEENIESHFTGKCSVVPVKVGVDYWDSCSCFEPLDIEEI